MSFYFHIFIENGVKGFLTHYIQSCICEKIRLKPSSIYYSFNFIC